MITNILGFLIILISLIFFKMGLTIDDSESGYHLMNINLIGIAILLFIGGIALLIT